MSDININNERQLMKFLKIIAEESLIKSFNENYTTDTYKKQYELDSKKYNLKEEEDPEEAEPADELETLATDNIEDEEDGELVEPKEEEETNEIPVVSYEAIKNAINDLRASRSLKNKESDDKLSSFYEMLDDNERMVLLSYLESLTDILNLTGTGQDPSEEPLNIDMQSAEDQADQEAEEDAAETEEPESGEEAIPAEEAEEDTTPPIELSENRRNDDNFRRKIRQLMRR